MIDFEFIERLIRALDDSSVDSLEIERGGTRVRLSKTPASPVVAPAVATPVVAAAPAGMSNGYVAIVSRRPPGFKPRAPARSCRRSSA